ncbi:MAG: hypothetical protein ACREJC_08260 [Tepidisphaeraceae bacterium]
MHILIVTSIGLIALFVTVAVAGRGGKPVARAARAFIASWLIISAAHLCCGVFAAGYSLLDELLVHTVIFGVPAGIAVFLALRKPA